MFAKLKQKRQFNRDKKEYIEAKQKEVDKYIEALEKEHDEFIESVLKDGLVKTLLLIEQAKQTKF